MSIHEQMESLPTYIGREVIATIANYGSVQEERGVLREICPYGNAVVGAIGVPFVGYGSAIYSIRLTSGEMLYSNPAIEDGYDERAHESMERVLALSFGEAKAEEHRSRRLAEEAAWKRRVDQSNAEAQAQSEQLISDGLSLVASDKADEWREFATKNTQDGYSCAVVRATIGALRALAGGQSPKESKDAAARADDGLSGFQMGCVAKAVSFFSVRGEEFRKYWNAQYFSPQEAEVSKGVVNPAILTIQV